MDVARPREGRLRHRLARPHQPGGHRQRLELKVSEVMRSERPVNFTLVAVDDAPQDEADSVLRRAEGSVFEKIFDGARVPAHAGQS